MKTFIFMSAMFFVGCGTNMDIPCNPDAGASCHSTDFVILENDFGLLYPVQTTDNNGREYQQVSLRFQTNLEISNDFQGGGWVPVFYIDDVAQPTSVWGGRAVGPWHFVNLYSEPCGNNTTTYHDRFELGFSDSMGAVRGQVGYPLVSGQRITMRLELCNRNRCVSSDNVRVMVRFY